MKATIDQLREAHRELGNVHKVGERFRMNGSTVHERLQKAGYKDWKNRPWTDEDSETLVRDYANFAHDGILNGLALAMGRTKPFICRKARDLGLTDPSRARPYMNGNGNFKRLIAEKGHPRGMAGKNHSPQSRLAMSQSQSARWDGLTDDQKNAQLDASIAGRKLSDGKNYEPIDAKKTWRAGWREIGPIRKYYRSQWEANYARYLQWLLENGKIAAWSHEPETFWFEGVRRGVCSYKPDFRVTENNGRVVWHEVKGWMDDRSRIALKRMAKHYPSETVIVIEAKAYRQIKGTVGIIIDGWE